MAASKWTDRRDFWSEDLIPAADAAAMEARHDASARLAAKLAGATIRLRELLASLSPAAQATVRRSLAGRSPGASIDHDERAKCPVCGEQGWLVCAVEEDHREVDTGEGIFSQNGLSISLPEEGAPTTAGSQRPPAPQLVGHRHRFRALRALKWIAPLCI